ncbi:LPS export ABC transporter periplasmic protein LptC [Thalassotalea aquiviva]|uniref:LPS export ABC transporter periplasmic protein LptC n=1 Tax=Thalassotalea aquiviva TaxID=3242415 RepID=UPI00352ABC89
MSRLHTISTIIFAIAIMIYGYIQWQKSMMDETEPVADKNIPDFIAQSLSSNQYDIDGKLSHTIYADEMTHFADEQQTLFKKPRFTIYLGEGKPNWTISALSGSLTATNQLTLSNQVRLISSDENGFIKEIQGEELSMDLVVKEITSDQEIIMKGRDFTLYGAGLFVDINSTQMTISEHVKTIYKKHAY